MIKQNKWTVTLAWLLMVLLALAGTATQAWAATTNNFMVQALLPDNQISRKTSYFDLRTQPGQRQTIQLQVTNPGEEELMVTTALNAASTGQDGIVEYATAGVRDESMRLSVEDLGRVVNPQILVQPGATALVNVELAMPETAFDGVVLGGLNVSARPINSVNSQAAGGGVQLQNEFVYVVGLQLSQTDAQVAPELHLQGIRTGLVNYRTSLTFSLQNSEPVLMKDMRVEARVYKGGSEQPFLQKEFTRVEMAPTSTGDFVMGWGESRMEAGNYRVYVRAEHQDRIWEWDEGFAISAGMASDANSGAVNIGAGASRSFVRYLPFLLILLLAAAVYFWMRRRREHRRKDNR